MILSGTIPSTILHGTRLSMINGVLKGILGPTLSRSWLFRPLGISLYTNSIHLVLNSAVTGLLGFGFWVAVARLYRESDVGLASALISTTTLLALLAGFGLDYGLIRFLAVSGGQARKLLNSVFVLSGLIAVLAAGVFLAGIPLWSPALTLARQHPAYIIGFLGVVPAIVFLGVLNGAFIGSRRSSFVLLQGSLTGVLRILFAIILVAFFGTFGIFASWALSVGAVSALGILIVLPRLYSGYRPSPAFNLTGLKEMLRYSFVNYLTVLFWNAPIYLLPLIVVNRLGAEANAYFFIAMAMAGLIWSIPMAVSLSLLAEGSHNEKLLRVNSQRSVRITALLLVPAILLIWLLGDKLLLAFGAAYSREATQVLRILALTTVPLAINYLYLGVRRVEKRMTGPLGLTFFVTLIALLWAFLMLPSGGIVAGGIALLGANGAGAIWVLWQAVIKRRSRQAISI
ncbi:MAG: oligosaccharide flippase family protein [Dehalococcoidia bacterium]